MAKPLDGDKSFVVVRIQHVLALGHVASHEPTHGAFAHGAAFLQYHIVIAPFDFKEDRRAGLVVVIPKSKFVPVPIAIDRVPVGVEAI